MTWLSYRRQERKLVDSTEYVAIDPANLNTWGEAYADLLRTIGDDMDSFFREMEQCTLPAAANTAIATAKSQYGRWDIRGYMDVFEPLYELSMNTVEVPFGWSSLAARRPFGSFAQRQSPVWWQAYNNLKHRFYEDMRDASLGNVIDALAGLLILNALHKDSQRWLANSGVLETGFRDVLGQGVARPYLADRLINSKIGVPSSTRISAWVTTALFVFELRTDPSC